MEKVKEIIAGCIVSAFAGVILAIIFVSGI